MPIKSKNGGEYESVSKGVEAFVYGVDNRRRMDVNSALYLGSLSELLVKKGLITEEEVQEALSVLTWKEVRDGSS